MPVITLTLQIKDQKIHQDEDGDFNGGCCCGGGGNVKCSKNWQVRLEGLSDSGVAEFLGSLQPLRMETEQVHGKPVLMASADEEIQLRKYEVEPDRLPTEYITRLLNVLDDLGYKIVSCPVGTTRIYPREIYERSYLWTLQK